MDLPIEFLTRMEALLGEEYPEYLRSYSKPRRFGLRVNTLKISPEEFCRIAPFHLKPIPWTDCGFFYEREDAPARHPFYYAGLYYLQEPSAMAPAAVLPVSPGERVLDLCAAPGGKATALAAKLQQKGLLVANDRSASRAKALLKNLEIFGTVNSFVTNTTPDILAAQYPESFDKILVDAPCSGEGMFRKDIANAKAWSLEKVEACAKIQREILLQAASMLRPGGMMLYSTCTFSPEEDEQAVAFLLEQRPELELVPIPRQEGFLSGRPELCCPAWTDPAARAQYDREIAEAGENDIRATLSRCVRLFPHRVAGEGHFLALLKKREDKKTGTSVALDERKDCVFSHSFAKQPRGKGKKKRRDALAGAAKRTEEAALGPALEFLEDVSRKDLRSALELHGSLVYYVPESPGVSGKIPFLRSGLYLGEIRKGRFEPSQAFAMALRQEDYASVLCLDPEDERVQRYLRGETIEADDLIEAARGTPRPVREKGWQLVCVEGYPLGWGKLCGGLLKNKYHSGWRMQNAQ